MIKITREQWDSICADYKGEWQDYHNDHPEWTGKKVVMSTCITENPNELCKLLVEGVHFEIVDTSPPAAAERSNYEGTSEQGKSSSVLRVPLVDHRGTD